MRKIYTILLLYIGLPGLGYAEHGDTLSAGGTSSGGASEAAYAINKNGPEVRKNMEMNTEAFNKNVTESAKNFGESITTLNKNGESEASSAEALKALTSIGSTIGKGSEGSGTVESIAKGFRDLTDLAVKTMNIEAAAVLASQPVAPPPTETNAERLISNASVNRGKTLFSTAQDGAQTKSQNIPALTNGTAIGTSSPRHYGGNAHRGFSSADKDKVRRAYNVPNN